MNGFLFVALLALFVLPQLATAQENGKDSVSVATHLAAVVDVGVIVDAHIVKSSGDVQLDAEAVRIVGIMPKWFPGYVLCKPVRAYANLPIVFRLR